MTHKFAPPGLCRGRTEEALVNLHLFDGDGFYGRLLCLTNGAQVPVHSHDHRDECFDVVEGEGTFMVDGEEIHAGPGAFLYIPSGTQHGLRADGTERWVLRETVSDRVYARRALALTWRAVVKRLASFLKTFGVAQK